MTWFVKHNGYHKVGLFPIEWADFNDKECRKYV